MPEPEIIFQNADCLVLNKPAGLAVHPDRFTSGGTLADWLLSHWPELSVVGEPVILPDGTTVPRPGIVHRLDRDTTGVLVVAKNQTAFEFFKEQFAQRTVSKEYRAILLGQLKNDQGVIDLPIGRSRKDPRRRLAGRGATGQLREALTEYQVLERFAGFVYVAAFPKTGRTHQLRAHFKAISAPIACDPLYGAPACPPGLARQALHAYRVELALPTGGRQGFTAPLPQDLTGALEQLRAGLDNLKEA